MNQESQKRTRTITSGMKVRENADGSESRVLEGRAIVFDTATTIYESSYYKFEEKINRSCVTEDFLSQQDVKLNLFHNRSESVCRNNKGEGTLQMEIREDGLYWSAEMPKCDLGDRALELVRNKTITGCSFEFFEEEYTDITIIDEDGRECTLREQTKFGALTALTLAMDPAYEQTSVNEREKHAKHDAEIKAKRENHADDAEVEFQREVQRAKREARKALRATKVNTLW